MNNSSIATVSETSKATFWCLKGICVPPEVQFFANEIPRACSCASAFISWPFIPVPHVTPDLYFALLSFVHCVKFLCCYFVFLEFALVGFWIILYYGVQLVIESLFFFVPVFAFGSSPFYHTWQYHQSYILYMLIICTYYIPREKVWA